MKYQWKSLIDISDRKQLINIYGARYTKYLRLKWRSILVDERWKTNFVMAENCSVKCEMIGRLQQRHVTDTDQLDVVAEGAGVVHPVALAPHHLQKMVEWRLVIVEDKNILPGIDELLKCNFFSSCKLWIFIMWRGGERGKGPVSPNISSVLLHHNGKLVNLFSCMS